MTSDLISRATDGYLCHVCLMSSSSPSKCTHCGEKIELTDINEATFRPPEYGTYFVPYNFFSSELTLHVIRESELTFYQSYSVKYNKEGIMVSSNHIAYQIFSTTLSEKTSIGLMEIVNIIPFIPEIARGPEPDT